MLAVARALQPDADAVMFTLSAALPIPVGTGMTVEHLASAEQFGATGSAWNTLLSERLNLLISAYRPDALLFDGVHPYLGVRGAVTRNRRRLVSIWVRRGMWKPDVAVDSNTLRQLAQPFDHVIEPGDYAAPYDLGVTARNRATAELVPPIVFEGEGRRPDRERACADLGLRTDDINVLVQLGAGQINDIRSTVGAVVSTLGGRPSVRTVLARSVLSSPGAKQPEGVVEVRRFPITHWIAAFDAAIVAAGYNSFQEMLSLRVPTIVVPNLSTRTDDQDARAVRRVTPAWGWLGRRGRRRAHGRRRHAPRSCRTGPDGPRTGRARSGRGRRGGRTPRDWLAAVTGDSPRTAPRGHSVYLVVLRLLPASGQRCLRSLATTIRQSRGRLRLSRRRLLRRIARASCASALGRHEHFASTA